MLSIGSSACATPPTPAPCLLKNWPGSSSPPDFVVPKSKLSACTAILIPCSPIPSHAKETTPASAKCSLTRCLPTSSTWPPAALTAKYIYPFPSPSFPPKTSHEAAAQNRYRRRRHRRTHHSRPRHCRRTQSSLRRGDSLYRNAAWPRIPPRPAGRISAFPHQGRPAQGRLARHQGPHPARLAAQLHSLPQTAAPVPSRGGNWRRRLRFRPSYGRGDPYGNPHPRLRAKRFSRPRQSPRRQASEGRRGKLRHSRKILPQP